MTQEIYQKAMKFAGEKHHDQLFPGSTANYLLHLASVSMEILLAYQNEPDFELDYALQMAILHDVIEDTDTTFEEVKEHFGKKVAEGVNALTKDNQLSTKADQMADSLMRINHQPKEVGIVKLADRITNLQQPPNYWSTEKKITYRTEAQSIVEALSGKNEYLEQRLLSKISSYQSWISKAK